MYRISQHPGLRTCIRFSLGLSRGGLVLPKLVDHTELSLYWFSWFDKLVKGVLVWGGEQEVLIDSIDAIAQRLKVSCPNTDYVRSQGGAHVGWLSHKLLMISGKEESTRAIESWTTARL